MTTKIGARRKNNIADMKIGSKGDGRSGTLSNGSSI